MTAQAIRLELAPREVLGKEVKRLRRVGVVPVHLYGPGVDSRPLQCEFPKLIEVLSKAGGNTPISVTVRGEPGNHLAFVREIQWDPRRDSILHVDFLVAQASRPVSAQVPIVLLGESPAARAAGAAIVHQLRELSVVALPLEMPGELQLDLAELTEAGGALRAGQVRLPSGVTLLTDPDEVVVRIEMPRAVAAEEAAAAEAIPAAEPTGPEGATEAEDRPG